MRYAEILNADDSIIKEKNYDSFDADAVSHKFGPDKEKRIIPVVKLDDPTIDDTATHQFGPVVVVVEATRVTKQRTVVAIPQEQLDRMATDETLKSWIPTFAAKNATNNQVQRVLEELLKRSVGGE